MNTKLLVGVIAVFAFTTQMAVAQKKGKAKEAAVPATTETYKIDAAASTIEWTGSKATGSSHNGTIAVKDGELQVAGNEIKSGKVTAKMDTLLDKDLQGEYKTKLETHLKSEDFFNVTKYPESTFTIKSVSKKSDTEINVKGDLTMIGKTEAVEFPATFKMEAGKITGTAELKLDRTKWNLKYGSGKFFKNLGDKLINDEFTLKMNLTAKK